MSGSFKCSKCGTTTWGHLKCCPNCGAKMSKEGRVKNDY